MRERDFSEEQKPFVPLFPRVFVQQLHFFLARAHLAIVQLEFEDKASTPSPK